MESGFDEELYIRQCFGCHLLRRRKWQTTRGGGRGFGFVLSGGGIEHNYPVLSGYSVVLPDYDGYFSVMIFTVKLDFDF